MELPTTEVLSLIPQRPPFVLIDELLAVADTSARSRFKIEATHVLVEKGYLSEAGLLENMAQTAAARAGYEALLRKQQVANGYITVIKQLNIVALPPVGAELFTEIQITDQIFNTTLIAGQVWWNGEQIADCEINVLTKIQEEDAA